MKAFLQEQIAKLWRFMAVIEQLVSFTIHVKRRSVLRSPAAIFSVTSVVSSMHRFDGFNTQHANPLVVPRYHDAIITNQWLLNTRRVRVRPRNFNRQISFVHSARCRHHLIQVDLIRTEIKRHDLRNDLDFEINISDRVDDYISLIPS